MAPTQTLALIQEIESLVSDKLQVVSYKWLSRNYMISSNEAKRLLHEFVQKHGGGLEVVYALSGWLKSSHPNYHIRLVTGPKLAEVQQEFDGNCSIQVYSVQASIPKDPAVLWNEEFDQAEELFKKSPSDNNCLRDNRFCRVSNSFVQRNVDVSSVVSAAPRPKSAAGAGPTKSNMVSQNNSFPQPQKVRPHDSIPKVDLKSQNTVKDVKSESTGTVNTEVHDQNNKPTTDKEKVLLPLPAGKKKVQSDKSCSATGVSLASFWGRANAKPKPSSLPAENSDAVSNPAADTVDAQTCVHEAGVSDSGDDSQDINLRRSSNSKRSRKRRVVFDFSDEDEYDDAIKLASPDFPNKQLSQDHIKNEKSPEKATFHFNMQMENKSKVKEERAIDRKDNQTLREDFSVISKCTSTGKSFTDKSQSCAPEISVNKDSVNNAAPGSPKRRKVMKTRIDQRGREVTEVVWEGEETEAKKADKVTTKKADNNVSTNTVNSAPAAKKLPVITNTISNPSGKGGSKKAGNSKDPKQGNILSFFKRV